MSAPALPTTPPAFGEAMDPDAALTALTNNDIQPGTPGTDNDGGTGDELDRNASDDAADRAATARQSESDDNAPPSPSRPAKKAKPVSKRALARMPKGEVARLYLAEREKAAALAAQLADAAQVATVHEALSSDAVNTDVEEMVGDVLGAADAALQLSVGEKYAAAVALEDAELARLKVLGARVAKARAGKALAHASPEIALSVCVVSIALSKYIAFRIAQKEAAAS